MSEKQTLVLVDGSSLAFRSFFALMSTGMRTKDGKPTWAVQGFFNSIAELIEKHNPDMLAVCFDRSEPTFRHEKYDQYKAHRPDMPDDLSTQWPILKDGVEVLGIPLYELPGYEADDIIGTVAKEAERKGMRVLILTGDQDAFQLLDESIQVLMPIAREGIHPFGRKEVFEKLGIYPEQVRDYKGLCGDSSDNIPGVRGIGPKTAVQLLSAYQTIEGIYEHLDEIKSASVKKKLEDGRQAAIDSKDLATIDLNTPIDFDFEHCKLTCPDIEEVTRFFQNLEFRSLTAKLPKLFSKFPACKDGAVHRSHRSSPDKKLADHKEALGASVDVSNDKHAVSVAERPSPEAIVDVQVTLHEQEPLSPLKTPSLASHTDELNDLIKRLKAQKEFALVVETSTDDSLECEIKGIAFAWQEDKVETAYVPLRGTHTADNQLSADEAFKLIKPILEDKTIGKMSHDVKFAMNALSLEGIELKPVNFDPLLASYLVNQEEKHDLKEQAQRILNYSIVVDEASGTGKKQLTLSFLPIDKVATTQADQARIIFELAKHYRTTMSKEQEYLLRDMELPLSVVLARMEQTGMALDLNYLGELSVELTKEITRLEKEIYGLAGHAFNINSTQQLQKVLFDELGLQSKSKTKSGYSTDASVLESLREEHAIIPKLLEYRHMSKLRSTYVDALPREISPRDQRIHGEFRQTGTSTGRLSSSNPNLQNIPIRTELGKSIRKAFIPGHPDYVLLSADYSQIELRILAHMSGDPTLADAFAQNQDVHARTASSIFDVPLTEVTSQMRNVGKTMNFALVYQQGAFATAQSLGVSNKEAQAFIDKYFATYPKVKNFMTETIEDARKTGYVSTVWGRHRYFRHLNDKNDGIRRAEERAACNAPLQGSAADLMKLAMIRLDEKLSSEKLKAKLILQVHDELVVELPKSELEKVKEVVREAMLLDQPLSVPLRVDIGVGPNWMEAK